MYGARRNSGLSRGRVFVVGILIGLAIATALVIGWGFGSFVVAVFLTLGDLLVVILLRPGADPGAYLLAIVTLAAIWAPFSIRRYLVRSRLVVGTIHQFVDPPVQRPPGQDVLTLIHQERPGHR